LDVSKLDPGLYVIEVAVGNEVRIKRFMKK